MNYYILTENDESKWNDQAGIRYHFPQRYFKWLQPGTKIIYYKSKMQKRKFADKRLSKDPHYFGFATIGEVEKNKDKTYNASFRDFHLFAKAVPFKIGEDYLEVIPTSRKSNYWRDGVRPIDETLYNKILELAEIELNTGASIYNDVELSAVDAAIYLEGGQKLAIVTLYERNQQLRDKAIEIHGYSCKVCGFNFGETYGEWGEGFIHIHHKNPVAQNAEVKTVNPETDLVPLCANCHAMVHRRKNKILNIETLMRYRK